MKKLIVMFSAVACAFAVNAAATSWDFYSYLEDGNTGATAEGTISVYLGDTLLSTMTLDYGTAQDTFDIDVGTLKVIAEVTNFKMDDGGVGHETGTLEWTYDIPSLPFSGDPNVEASLVKLQGYVDDAISNGYSLDLTASAADNGYTAVPEPTSGLLLLLGVAGLAMRRRRA